MDKVRGMGRVFQRGGVWWIAYYVGGREIRKSSRSTDKAVADRMLKAQWKAVGAGRHVEPRAERTTVAELIEGLRLEYAALGRRSALEPRVRPILAQLGHLRATDITPRVIERYKAGRLEERTVRGTPVARGTVNRELAALKRAFTLAREQELVSASPLIKSFPEGKARQGFVDAPTFAAVVAGLPPVLADAATLAYGSAWRREEILGLEWSDVDREAGTVTLQAERSKNEEPRILPLTGELLEVIERRWAERAPCPFVFHHHGRRYSNIRGSWRKAVAAAGYPGLLFHDLRRSAIRNFDEAGVSPAVAMKISGHKTASVYRRYRIASTADIRRALERTQAHLAAQAGQGSKVVRIGG